MALCILPRSRLPTLGFINSGAEITAQAGIARPRQRPGLCREGPKAGVSPFVTWGKHRASSPTAALPSAY